MNPLSCSKKYIDEFISKQNLHKVNMAGMYDDLYKIKKVIEGVYSRALYMTCDAGWHGWDGEPLENMNNINDEIVKRMEEIYALCLIGRGEKMDDD